MKRTFKCATDTVIIKSSRGHGCVACFYTKFGDYAGCKHLKLNEVEDYIKYSLGNEYKEEK